MDKQFYAGGFLYNPHSKRVLLHKRDEKTDTNKNTWAFFGGLSKKGETPVQTFQREVKEELSVRFPLSKIKPLYDYFNPDFNVHRYVFYVPSSYLKSTLKLREGKGFEWTPLPNAFKFSLSKRTRQDLTFFQREINATKAKSNLAKAKSDLKKANRRATAK